MSGMSTLKGTTTFCVKHLPLTREAFVAMLKSSYEKSGFSFEDADIAEEADQLLSLAADFPTATVLEKRGNKMQIRA